MQGQVDSFEEAPKECLTCGQKLADKFTEFVEIRNQYVKAGYTVDRAAALANDKLGFRKPCCRLRNMRPNIKSIGAPPTYTETIEVYNNNKNIQTKYTTINNDIQLPVEGSEPIDYLKLGEQIEKVQIQDIIETNEVVKMRYVGEGFSVRVLSVDYE